MGDTRSLDNACEEIFDHMLEGCQVVGPDWRYLYLNDVAARHARRSKSELLGHRMMDAYPGIEHTPMFDKLAACLEQGLAAEMDYEFSYPDGTSAWYELKFRPVSAGVLILSLDTSERRQAETDLTISLQHFELLTWTAGELLRTSEPQRVVETLCSKVMAQLDCHAFFNYLVNEQTGSLQLNASLGITEEESRRIESLDYGVAVCGCVARDGGRIVAEHIFTTPDERTELVKSYGIRAYACHPLLEPGGKVIGTLSFGTRNRETFSNSDLSLMKAVTDQVAVAMIRMRNMHSLRASKRHLLRAEKIARLGHWHADIKTGQMNWSEGMYSICGVTPDDFQPTRARCYELVYPDDRKAVSRMEKTMLRQGTGDFAFRMRRPDGALQYMAGQGEVEHDGSGRPIALFGTLQDVSAYRQKERELQEKNAEQERFAYTISHDLRSPLVTVKTFLGYLEKDLASNNTARIERDMHYMCTAVDRMGQLLDELLEMIRLGHSSNPPQRVAFDELVHEALSLVAGQISERQVAVRVDPVVLTLSGDRPRLVDVWQNLVENAVKFMGSQAAPLIEAGVDVRGREAVFFIRDNGIGIDPRFHDKIFNLFEKLEPRTEGTGLGLALVRRIVEQYSGRIWVESPGAGQGACFCFTLPQALGDNLKNTGTPLSCHKPAAEAT